MAKDNQNHAKTKGGQAVVVWGRVDLADRGRGSRKIFSDLSLGSYIFLPSHLNFNGSKIVSDYHNDRHESSFILDTREWGKLIDRKNRFLSYSEVVFLYPILSLYQF